MKRILIPVDFSKNAYSALIYATRFFSDPAHFIILNTFKVDTPVLTSRLNTDKGNQIYKAKSAESQAKLLELKHTIVRDTEDYDHTFEIQSISKDLIETLNKTIKSKRIDYVVMGTQGVTGAQDIILGSNTVKAIQSIKNCPVMAIPKNLEYKKPEQIAFATGLKRFFGKEELFPLIELNTLLKAKLHIIHVKEKLEIDDVQEYHLNKIRQHLSEIDFTIHHLEEKGKKTERIQKALQDLEIDLLCMYRFRHSFLEILTREPILKKLGLNLSIPLLTIPVN